MKNRDLEKELDREVSNIHEQSDLIGNFIQKMKDEIEGLEDMIDEKEEDIYTRDKTIKELEDRINELENKE